MASGPHTFATLVVFSSERFQGNPLAIVAVRGNAISPQRKALIAREFRHPVTVFLHDAPGPGIPRHLEIFTASGAELPFAGHSIIGTAQYIFNLVEKAPYGGPADRDSQRQTAVFMTKAGRVGVFYNPYRQIAACSVPHRFHVHSKQVPLEKVLAVQPQVQIVPTIDKVKGKAFPVVSIMEGMNCALVDLTDAPEVFAALQAGKAPDVELDEGWPTGIVACLYYKHREKSEQEGEPTIHNLQTRMTSYGTENTGSGSAACALSCYLALTEATDSEVKPAPGPAPAASAPATRTRADGDADAELASKTAAIDLSKTRKPERTERKVFGIQEGVEIGRLSTMAVEVDVKREPDGEAAIVNVILSGRASFQTKGELMM